MPIRTRRPRAPLRALGPALAAALLPAMLGAQEAPPVVFKSNALEVAIGGRIHTQFNTTSAESEPATEIALRRVRLEATVKVNDWVSAKIQPEYAGSRVTLRDAYMRFAFDPALTLVAGQAHRPFGTVVPTSSTRILPIERGVRIRGLPDAREEHNLIVDLGYADRDVGLQLVGEPAWAPLGLSYAAGVFNGPARAEAREENTYQLAARAAIHPVEPLRLGVSWSRRDFAVQDSAAAERLDVRRGHAWAVDAEYGRYAPGLHLLGEVAMGDLDPASGAEFRGAQGWLGFRTGALGSKLTGVEPVVRVSWGDVDGQSERLAVTGGTLVTPGVNFYFGPLNRIMVNYDFWSPDGDGGSEGSFKVQFQAAF
ncbi:MAG: porin [Longimicrobiaceae bacterium]